MKELIEYIATSLVDNPGDVQVREIDNGQGSTLELTVARDDIGKVIGRQGRTARAMRILLGAASAKAQRRVMLEIQE
ncbi:MAG: KH domain-containing protein [Desulfovibrionaceae bacterium]|nr:KH domain-containing protein [Desulfovibrionaceae bacterium]